jgi:sortase A
MPKPSVFAVDLHLAGAARALARRAGLAGGVALLLLATVLGSSGSHPVRADDPAAPAATTAINPVELKIPAIGVDANIQDVGLADDGSMGVPVGFSDAAWYDLGVAPGQLGNAVFTGHISSTAAPGVFYNIDQLGPGNTIHVIGDDGTEQVYIVQEVDNDTADSVPLGQIFAPTSQPGVVLITCTGDWDPVAHLFSNRIVVWATLSTGQ